MRGLVRAVLLCVALGGATLIGLAWAMLDRMPSIVDTPAGVSAQAADRTARRIADLDPRKLRDGERRAIVLGTDEVKALVDTVAKRLPGTRAQATLGDGQLLLRSATALPGSFWLNVETSVVIADGLPLPETMQIGALSLPPPLARAVLEKATSVLLRRVGYVGTPDLIAQALHTVEITPHSVRIDYALSRRVAAEGLRTLLPPGEAERLAAYHEALRGTLLALRAQRRGATGGDVSETDRLPAAVQALFALARSRGGDALAERRSALLALALHTSGRSAASLLPEAESWPKLPPLALTLRGRADLGQHFAASALIAAHAGAHWANAVGLAKEVRDARGGSGFSFTDLMADRAGTRLGERIAAGNDEVAAMLASKITGEDLLPAIDGLAEFMPEAEFVRRYGGVGSPAYEAVLADIDARIAALELYR